MNNRASAVLAIGLLAFTLLLAPLANAQKLDQELAATSVLEIIKKRGSIKVGMSTFVP